MQQLKLALSLALNLFLLSYILLTVQWSRNASDDFQLVAMTDCSGHGRPNLDGVVGKEGVPSCECNNCYVGDDCSRLLPDCPADADSGNPLFLEPYWQQHDSSSTTTLSGWHGMSYLTVSSHFMSSELLKHIRQLHRIVGNAVVDDKHIVFGTGSSQLINALIYALSASNSSQSLATVVATPPYYPLYRMQTMFFDGKQYNWGGATRKPNESNNSSDNFIEFVTSPNNPDGLQKQSVLGGKKVIYDHAYYWPHYTAISTPADEDVMLFTITKASGHAGSRFGWALIKDYEVYKRAYQYIDFSIMGVSRDTQLRMLNIIKVMIAKRGEDDIFKFGQNVLKTRWSKLNEVISSSRRFSLQTISPQYSAYSERITEPSPAYAWLKCEKKEERNCVEILRKGGIISRTGELFEADSSFTRLSLIKTEDDFGQLLQRMKDLVSDEQIVSL